MLNNSNRKSSELVRLCRGLTNQEVNGEGSKVNGEGFWLLNNDVIQEKVFRFLRFKLNNSKKVRKVGL